MKLSKKQTEHVLKLAPRGRITPALVVADAKQKASPLHSLFPWDIKKAAARHWLSIASEIIRRVKVVVEVETIELKVPNFVRDQSLPKGRQGSISLLALKPNRAMARKALAEECARIAGNLKRAHGISIVLGLEPLFQKMIDQIVRIEQQLLEKAA